jgi:virginiamycin B lyase
LVKVQSELKGIMAMLGSKYLSQRNALAVAMVLLLMLTALMACFTNLKLVRAEDLYTITEYHIPPTPSVPITSPEFITEGPDGAMWFTEYAGNKISRVTTSGSITEYDIPTLGSQPEGIIAGPDGNLWFTEYGGALLGKIGKITPNGDITEYALPTAASGPYGITVGSDNNLWFTESDANKIGKITTTGDITEYDAPAGSVPHRIVAGPDGNLWFTEYVSGKIGKISTSGVVLNEFPLAAAASGPEDITVGRDGNLWFTQKDGNKIGMITTNGDITEYDVPTTDSFPYGISKGPDGNIWFTEGNGNKVAMITTSGVITEYVVPTAGSWPYSIAPGSDGYVWFTEADADQVSKIRVLPQKFTTAEIVPTLSLTPDRVAGTGVDNRLTLSIKLKNLGPGGAGYAWFEVPIEPTYLFDSANFGNSGMWVSKISATSVRVELRQLDFGASVLGSLVLKPNPENPPKVGSELSFKIQVNYSDEVQYEHSFSNKVSVTIGESDLDVNKDTLQTLAPVTVNVGEKAAISADVFLPNEKVILWYTGPNGNSVDLGYVWADENGKIATNFDTTGFVSGSYSFVAHGLKSEVRSCTIVTITGQSLTSVTTKAGDMVVISANVFLPSEKVPLWYTGQDGKSVDLGYVWSDENGKLVTNFDTTGLASGSYSFVAQGQRSNIQACTLVIVTAE